MMALLHKLSIFVIFTVFAGVFGKEYAPTIQTKAGLVRGNIREFNGKEVHIYEGIRYGEMIFAIV